MKKKIVASSIFILIGLVGMLLWQEVRTNDGKLHVVFCNVGQGDAIFIRTPNKTDILIDGGPDRKVLDCLSNHMPFWNKTLELVILSHPHQDHFAGLIDVIESYSILSFASEKLANESQGFSEFSKRVSHKGIKPRYLFAGDRIRTNDGVSLTILAPSQAFLSRTSPKGTIGESDEFGSLVIHVSYGEVDLLLTSDSQLGQLKEALLSRADLDIEVLQVPHHGSRFGIERALIEQLSPKLAVISVGKNRYGHPTEEVLKLLGDKDTKILRTDKDGEIEVISDGKTLYTPSLK